MERNEQKTNDTWDLSSLSASVAAWERDLKKLEKKIGSLAGIKGTLSKGSDEFHNALTVMQEVLMEAERLGSYCFLQYSADSTDAEVMSRAGRFEAVEAKLSEALAFFDPELLGMDETLLRKFLAEKRNKDFKVFVRKSLRYKKHVLDEKGEALLSLYSPVSGSFADAFQDLDNADLEFGEINGEKLTHSTYAKFIRSEDEEIRKQAYEKLYAGYENHRHVIARLYYGSVKNDIFEARARGYRSCLEKALFPDKVPQSVYRNLIATIHEAFPLLHRFYSIKARHLKKDKLNHYDVYMPLADNVKASYGYDEAVGIIREAVMPLGKEYSDILVDGLTTERWVDRYENRGKRSGAFSAGGYIGKPYILTNYESEVLDSVFTLIHEGGHSMHSWYSVRNNPFMSYNYTIFEAEVASTFNEQLLTHHLMENTQDGGLKKYLIGKNLDDMVATLFRQTMFAEYELMMHEDAEHGIPLTVDHLRKSYRGLLEQYFGPDVVFTNQSDLEGLRIPHFYRAFYTYKYATGISASIALSEKVLSGGEKEREDYLSFLRSGGSLYPIESLKKAGVDMTSPLPVRMATEKFGKLMDMYEEITG